MALREDLIQTAVQFLGNPQVKASPKERKTAFLEQKGLTQEEIEEALKRTGVTPATPAAAAVPAAAAAPVVGAPQPYSPTGQPYYYPQGQAPPLPPYPYHQQQQAPPNQWGWKDIFIGAVVAAGAGYVGFNALKVCLLLLAPSSSPPPTMF